MRTGSRILTGARAGLVAGAVTGLPSTIDAAVRGGLFDLYRGPGALVAPGAPPAAQLALTPAVHGAISAGWGGILGVLLPRRATVAWGAAAGLVVFTIDIMLVGRRVAVIRRLPLLPQVLDHVLFGAVTGALISRDRRRRPAAGRRRGGGSAAGAAP